MTDHALKHYTFSERNRLSGGYLLRKRITAIAVSVCRAILLFGLCFMILQPLLNKISISFMEESDLFNPIVVSIPLHFTTFNYELASTLMNYPKALVNSIWVSFTVATVQILMCTLVGYGFARFKFPLKKMWFACVLLIIIIPPQIIASSLSLHFKYFDIFGILNLLGRDPINLKGSILPYYLLCAGCMGLKSGLYIYMIRQYFRTIPYDLEEAAYIDGCGTLRTFFRIMLPQAKPIITSCFMFAFVWQWTDSFYSKMFLGNTKLVSRSLASIVDNLQAYMQDELGIKTSISVAWANCISATGTLMIVGPVILLYLVAQRQFVESISSTGIKM